MLPICNIAAYRFLTLQEPQTLANALAARARDLGVFGTCLLAHEGINLFMAAPAAQMDTFVGWLRADPRLADMPIKLSYSADIPFRKLLVKVKPEIIRMNHPAILPDSSREGGRAPAVDAATVKRWLEQGHDDSGRPVVTLDTRNAFEVDHGTFEGAIDWRIEKFSDFPQAFRTHKAELEGKTVVSFCTGGIRCEKAAILMREEGLEHVYQLEGGILKYFEETGGAHYNGECFVFDGRESLTPELAPATRNPPRGKSSS